MAKYYTLAQLEAILKVAPSLLKAVNTFNKVAVKPAKLDLTPKADVGAAKKLAAKLDKLYDSLETRIEDCTGYLADISSDLEDSIEELEHKDEDVQFAVMKGGRIIKTVEAPYKPKRGEKLIPMDE